MKLIKTRLQNKRKSTKLMIYVFGSGIKKVKKNPFVSHHVCCERKNLRRDGKSSRYLAQSSVVSSSPAEKHREEASPPVHLADRLLDLSDPNP